MSEELANANTDEQPDVAETSEENSPVEEAPVATVAEDDAAVEAETETQEQDEAVEEVAQIEEPETIVEEPEPVAETIDKAAFAEMVERFGADVAAEVALNGGDERDAEIASLKRQLAAKKPVASAEPASSVPVPDAPSNDVKGGIRAFMKGDEKHFQPKR